MLLGPPSLPQQLRTDGRAQLRGFPASCEPSRPLPSVRRALPGLGRPYPYLLVSFGPSAAAGSAAGPPGPVSHDAALINAVLRSQHRAHPCSPSAALGAARWCCRQDRCCKGAKKTFPRPKRLHEPPAFPFSYPGRLCWGLEPSLKAHGPEVNQELLDSRASTPALEQAQSSLFWLLPGQCWHWWQQEASCKLLSI